MLSRWSPFGSDPGRQVGHSVAGWPKGLEGSARRWNERTSLLQTLAPYETLWAPVH